MPYWPWYSIYSVVPPQSWGDWSDTKHSKCLLLGGRRLNQLTLIPKPKGSGGARPATAQVGPANNRNDTKRCLPVEASLRPGKPSLVNHRVPSSPKHKCSVLPLDLKDETLPKEEVQDYLDKIPYPGVKAVLDNAITPLEERAEVGVRPDPEGVKANPEEAVAARAAKLASTKIIDWKVEQKDDPVLYQVVKHLRASRKPSKELS